MKKNKIALISLLFILLLLGISCDKKIGKLKVDETPGPPPPPGACDTITYLKHIKPIIDSNCVSCHKTGVENGSTNLQTYESVKLKAEAGRIKQRAILDNPPNSMPYNLPKLPKKQLDLIQCWLDNGMKK